MNYSELLEIFTSSLILTNQVFNFLNKNYERLDNKNKLRHHILYGMKSTSTTIFHILTQNIDNQNLVDFSSAAILTRSIIESYKTFYYLTSEAYIDENEFEFRYLIFQAYDIFEREEMIRGLKAGQIEAVIDFKELEEQLDELKNSINNNNFYKQIKINNEQNKRYEDIRHKSLFSCTFKSSVVQMNGCFIKHKDVLLKRFLEINPGYEQYKEKIQKRYGFLYKYLSNFVHISPYSISQPSNTISIDDFRKVILPLIFYLNIATEDILDAFPELEEEIQVQKNYPDIFKGLDKFVEFLRCEIN